MGFEIGFHSNPAFCLKESLELKFRDFNEIPKYCIEKSDRGSSISCDFIRFVCSNVLKDLKDEYIIIVE